MSIAEVAQAVHACRKQSGLTQQQLAKLAGVGKTVIYDIEKGKDTVQLRTLLKVLNTLNIELKLQTPIKQFNEK